MLYDYPKTEIQKMENEIYSLTSKLAKLRKENPPEQVKNYILQTLEGDTSLLSLFGKNDKLVVIHNMGQSCTYCTAWADGINAFLPHLESVSSVVLMSKDSPEIQRAFAGSRGWRFRMASHGGGSYIQEQSVITDKNNEPGIVVYERQGERIFRKNSSVFGPGDQFCSLWALLSLAGLDDSNFTPQYRYWAPLNEGI